MSIRINPTFFLKGIDPQKLFLEYQSGVFSRQPVQKTKIEITQNTAILANSYGTNNYSPMFSIKDRNNCSVVIATTNNKSFEVFTKSGGELVSGGRCDYCKEDFNTIRVGYPIAFQETIILDTQSQYRTLYTFWVEGIFCSFECTLAYIKLMLSRPYEYRDSVMNDSERLLKLLYKLMYPNGKPLLPAQDPKLLNTNDGPLSKEEWKENKHTYLRSDRILILPVKVEYIQRSLNVSSIENL